jgi:hypothetical protein
MTSTTVDRPADRLILLTKNKTMDLHSVSFFNHSTNLPLLSPLPQPIVLVLSLHHYSYHFISSIFSALKMILDPSGKLMMLPSDLVLIQDEAFKVYVDLYAKDQKIFFKDFAIAFQKLEELGCENLQNT